ncbi:MAG: cell division protein SepF [Clostridiales bacterium]|nr:cell division protein SepF [Clostridiales bacterium]
MALNDLLYRVKDGWDRVIGSFLHGQQDDYGYDQFHAQAYQPQEETDYNDYYQYQPAENTSFYDNQYGYQPQPGTDERISPYAGSYAQQLNQQPEQPQNMQSAYGYEYDQGQTGYAEENNMVPFPGVSMDQLPQQLQNIQTQIIQLKSRETCKVIIEALRNNAAVLINMESIASDLEKQRCVDMLGGAAYTLNCQISKVSVKGVYMISPVNITIEMDEATMRLNGMTRSTAPTGTGQAAHYASQRPPLYRNNEIVNQSAEFHQPYAATYGEYNANRDGYYRQQPPMKAAVGYGAEQMMTGSYGR